MAATVGARIRRLRQARNTSLASLAASTGLGKGTLSEVERGQRNPTLDTLFAIAAHLELPLSDLLTEEHQPVGSGEGPRAHGQSIDATLIDRWREATTLVEVYRLSVSRQTRHSLPHSAGVIETLTLISGAVEVGNEGGTVQLEPSESHTFAGDSPHLYRGIARESTAILIMRYPDSPQQVLAPTSVEAIASRSAR